MDDEKEENLREISEELNRENIVGKKVKALQESQVRWAMFLMVGILLIIIVIPYININFINKFDYHGLTFQKTRLGEIEFFSTRFPVVSGTGQVIGDYAVNLRNDPRELEKIEVRATFDDIDFRYYKDNNDNIKYYPVYVSLDPSMSICEDGGIALITLSGFLKDSGLEVKGANINKSYAEENNLTYKRCANDSSVIIVTSGNENKITEIGETCYEIRFKDCDILKVSERFILNILEQYGEKISMN